MTTSKIKVTLITGRSLGQGETLDIGKITDEYFKKVAVIELDEKDLKKLGISNGKPVKVKTNYGSVIAFAVKSKFNHQGVAFMPMGPWANIVCDYNTYGSGMPTFKGVEAEITPTEEKPLSTIGLIKTYYKVEPQKVKLEKITVEEGEEEKIYEAVICTFCGCLCDDLQIKVKGNKIIEVKRACQLGKSKILHRLKNRILHPLIKEKEKYIKVDYDTAIKKTAEILVNASFPLLYGWSSTSTEAIRLGVELAELVGAAFDNTSVMCHGPTILGVQEVGTVSASLGQIRNYADLIIYWGCNPVFAHPRHLARYSAMARGAYVKTRKERKIVVVDVRETPTAKIADLFIKVKANSDYELIKALRMIVNDLDVEVDEVGGVPLEKIYELADMMRSAKFGAILFGLGVTMTRGKGRNIEEVIRLVQDLNDWTKFVLLPMRGHYNVVGANMASLWLTGFPYALDFTRGYPRHNPGVTSATELLLNEDVDAALIVASDPVAHFPAEAVKNLAKIPVITIDPKWNMTCLISKVIIPSAFAGIECEGSAYRMDKVVLHLKKVVEPPKGILSDEAILKRIIKEVKKLRRS